MGEVELKLDGDKRRASERGRAGAMYAATEGGSLARAWAGGHYSRVCGRLCASAAAAPGGGRVPRLARARGRARRRPTWRSGRGICLLSCPRRARKCLLRRYHPSAGTHPPSSEGRRDEVAGNWVGGGAQQSSRHRSGDGRRRSWERLRAHAIATNRQVGSVEKQVAGVVQWD